jgi:cytochrome b6-f complex iron-sulfur subunit
MANTNDKSSKPEGVLKEPAKRDFLTKSLAGFSTALVGFILYPLGKFLKQPPAAGGNIKRTIAATVADVPNDSGLIFRFGNDPGIVLRTPGGELKAFTAVCTHLACTVQYVPVESYILCACHDGKYDLNGQVISGPPPRPLEEYQVDIQDDNIVVTKE